MPGDPATVNVYGGFDPGLVAGISVIGREGQHVEVLVVEAVVTKPADPLKLRLEQIWTALSRVLRAHRPLALCIEHQEQAQVSQAKSDRFTADTSKVNQVVGLAKGCCLAYGVPYLEVSPARAKIALLGPGAGRAGKAPIKQRVQLLTGRKRLRKDAADAVALAFACEQELRRR